MAYIIYQEPMKKKVVTYFFFSWAPAHIYYIPVNSFDVCHDIIITEW